MNPQYGKLHQYRTATDAPNEVLAVKCCNEWYPIGASPCEDAERIALPAPEDLPPCEVSDEDLAAARELLGVPHLSLCLTKDRASWLDADTIVNASTPITGAIVHPSTPIWRVINPDVGRPKLPRKETSAA